jgi:hypothetical protein
VQFEYHSEPTRGALLATAALIVCAALVPVALFRTVLLAIAAGPGTWTLIQWLRRGRGVQAGDEHLLIRGWLAGRVRSIPYAAIRGHAITQAGGLMIAYRQPESPPPRTAGSSSLALTDLRPESYQGPRYRLIVTPPVDRAGELGAALDARVRRVTAADDRWFSADQLLAWARQRRIRNIVLALLLLAGTPLYVIIAGRIVASILSFGAR